MLGSQILSSGALIVLGEFRFQLLTAFTHGCAVFLAVRVVESDQIAGVLGRELIVKSKLKNNEQADT